MTYVLFRLELLTILKKLEAVPGAAAPNTKSHAVFKTQAVCNNMTVALVSQGISAIDYKLPIGSFYGLIEQQV